MMGEVGRHGKYDTVCLVGVSSHDTKQQAVANVQTTEKRLRPIISVICVTCTCSSNSKQNSLEGNWYANNYVYVHVRMLALLVHYIRSCHKYSNWEMK